MKSRPGRRRAGFTLAEVAITIVIVGIGLVMILQGLNGVKLLAAQTRNYKLARELGLLTLGQVESGLFQEDVEDGLIGTYAEEGYPDFAFEVGVGDEAFPERREDGGFDSWAPRDSDEEEDEDEEAEEPFEKVRVRVTFPQIQEYSNELVLERWVPWKQVYGESEEPDAAAEGGDTTAAAGGSGGGGR